MDGTFTVLGLRVAGTCLASLALRVGVGVSLPLRGGVVADTNPTRERGPNFSDCDPERLGRRGSRLPGCVRR